MKLTYDEKYYEIVVSLEAGDEYIEDRNALPTSRILSGSRDEGHMAEYKGYGHVGELPVIAIYLIGWDDKDTENEGDYDWDKAFSNGRIIVDVDAMSNEEYDALLNTLTRRNGMKTEHDYHCPVCGWEQIRAGGPNGPVYDVCTNSVCDAPPIEEVTE